MIRSVSIHIILLFLFFDCHAQILGKDTLTIKEVVVTGTKIEVSRRNIPLTVSVVTDEEMNRSIESALLPVLSEYVPGLFVTQRGITGFGVAGGAAGQITIRGLGGDPTSQVLVLIDGHPQFMGMMGHPLPDAYVASDAERVEIIRGPGSLLYGTNAFGGVINIITKKQKKDGFVLNARAIYGSYQTQKYTASAGYRKNKLNLFGSLNHDRTNGHRDSSDFMITNGYIKAGYRFTDYLDLTADANFAAYEAADPGKENQTAGNRIDILRGKVSLSLDNEMEKISGALKLFLNFGEHAISDGWNSRDEMKGLMFYQVVNPLNGMNITFGFDHMNYGGKGSPVTTFARDDDGNIIFGPGGPQVVLSDISDRWISMKNNALYSFLQQTLFTRLVLSTGIRYEINKVYGNEWIPQVGASFHISDKTSIKTSFSKGYRAPSIRELYLFPPANEYLEPEKMVNYELTWMQAWNSGILSTELTTFFCNGDNLIVRVPAAPPPPPQYKNSGNFSNAGVEFTADLITSKYLRLHSNYAFIHMKIPMRATPEHSFFISGTYDFRKFSFHLKAQIIANLYGEADDGLVRVVEKRYTLIGMKATYRPAKYINLFINAENLLNREYQINYGYPMPGTTFFAGVSIRLENK